MKQPLKTDQKEYPDLVKLGLSLDMSRCYTCLLTDSSLTSGEIAKKLGIFPNAVYRLTKKLKNKGLIVELNTHPVKFQAIPVDVAITSLSDQKMKEIESAKLSLIAALTLPKTSHPQTQIEIVTGRKQMMDKYVELARHAVHEILLISIGEPVGDAIKLINRDAQERGVSIKFIVHKYDASNENLLKSYVRMGMEVKHYPDWGYHLMIFDNNLAVLATNNPQDTEERTSMVIYSQGLSHALGSYFYSLWEKASPIK